MATKVAGEMFESLIGQLFEIGRQLRQPNGYPFNPEQLKRHLQAAIEGQFGIVRSSVTYPITVNYNLTVEQMVESGGYDHVDSDITESHFSSRKKGTTNVVVSLFYFGRPMETDEVLRELDILGFRPADAQELLAFGARYPKLQQEFPVAELGSVWLNSHDNCCILCLGGYGLRRDLYLRGIKPIWEERYCFAAVRKSASEAAA